MWSNDKILLGSAWILHYHGWNSQFTLIWLSLWFHVHSPNGKLNTAPSLDKILKKYPASFGRARTNTGDDSFEKHKHEYYDSTLNERFLRFQSLYPCQTKNYNLEKQIWMYLGLRLFPPHCRITRSTWASPAYGVTLPFGNYTWRTRLIFVLGSTSDDKVMRNVRTEAAQYGDILQGMGHMRWATIVQPLF